MMKIGEDNTYHFDAEAADRPIRFVQSFVHHFEGKWAGQTLVLQDWQRQTIRDLYGWKHKETGKRRFTELFLLTAKGAGKTPFLSAIGMYELFAGGEPASHVVSMASSYKQANLTMEFAKKSIVQDSKLEKRSEVTQYEIRCEKNNSKWTTISGTFSGNAGFRPSCILADEAWEWKNSKLYDSVTANLFKRREPLVLVATNAGENRNCFCWKLYEQAKAVLSGRSNRKDLLPVIFEAPLSLDWTSEAAAVAACPSIPDVVSFESLQAKIVAAKESPAAEAEYRRLHLSQWIAGGSTKWLDMHKWDACTKGINVETIKNAVLYVGLDLSQGDDLCAVVYIYVTPDKMYVTSHFWLPRITAEKYESKNGIPYKQWEKSKHITLIEEATISPDVKRRIAAHIIATRKSHTTKAVCYDRYKADDAVAAMEAAGLICVPIPQGYTLTPGAAELERRLVEESIVIAPNDVLRANAEVVEIKTDERGNFWPVKPGYVHSGNAGYRPAKVDGIVALVSGLVEARKHSFPKTRANAKAWII